MSAEEIDTEVGRSGDVVSVTVEESAVLEDGRRVITDERHGNCGIDLMGAFIALAAEGARVPSEMPDLRPTRAMLENEIREAIRGPENDDTRWGRLIFALHEAEISVTGEELDGLPFSLEIAPGLRDQLRD